jgi:hypothetical protein
MIFFAGVTSSLEITPVLLYHTRKDRTVNLLCFTTLFAYCFTVGLQSCCSVAKYENQFGITYILNLSVSQIEIQIVLLYL